MAWKADSLQGVLFTTPGAPQLDAQQLWSLATDSLPETVQRPADVPTSLSIASGLFEGHRLAVHSQLGRIDWMMNAQPQGTTFSEPPRIEKYQAASQQLRDLMIRALAAVRPVRTAFVGEFGRVFDTEASLIGFLTEQTGGVWFPEPAQDCIYQINVRKSYAGADDVLMNRLVTWSGSMYQMFTGVFPSIGMNPSLSPGHIVLAASLKIDANSHTVSDISANAPEIISANCAEVLAIAESGIKRLR
jgi:hypothetical protein